MTSSAALQPPTKSGTLSQLEADRAAAVADRPNIDMGRRLMAVRHGLAEPQESARAVRAPRSIMHELSNAISAELNILPRMGGVFIPTRFHAAGAYGLDTGALSAGSTVGTNIRDFVDVLAAETTVTRLGAQIISGLKGNTAWPLESALPVASWVEENPGSDTSEDDAVFGQAPATPKMLTSTTSYSRKLLAESAPGIDGFVKRRLARATGIALDAAAINGSGTTNQPTGLLKTPLVSIQVMGVNGATITVSALHGMEKALSDQNATATGLLTTTGVRRVLRGIPPFAGGTTPTWDGNTVLGYRGEVSTQVPSNLTKGTSSPPTSGCHALILGDWTNMLICEWGVLELVIDPFTAKKSRMIQVTSYGMYDVCVVRPSAFCICVDALV